MYDQYNRKIDYLRISLTDRCNLHCRYCQPEVSEHVPHNEILRYEELLRICRAALQLGIRKFKITGGEPLLRKCCSDFIAGLKQIEGVEQVTADDERHTAFAAAACALSQRVWTASTLVWTRWMWRIIQS